MSDLQIEYWSPLPPLRTGIADYSATLLSHLADACAIRLVVDTGYDACPPGDLGPVESVTDRPAHAETDDGFLRVYQMGNNVSFHAFMYAHMLACPGVVVLHDVILTAFHQAYFNRAGNLRGFLDELEFCEGRAGAAQLLGCLRDSGAGPDLSKTPMFRRVVETSRAVVVHTRWAKEFVHERCPNSRVVMIPHGVDVSEDASHFTSAPRSAGFVVGAFGIISKAKRIDVLLRAAASLVVRIPDLRVVVAGPFLNEEIADELTDLTRRLNLSGHVTFAGDLDLDDFTSGLRACDVIVNLRYPGAGETSGAMMRAFGAGKPVITTDIPSFAEYPSDCCIHIPVGVDEVNELSSWLLRLAQDETTRLGMGAAARELASRAFAWPIVARQYLDLLRDVAGSMREGDES